MANHNTSAPTPATQRIPNCFIVEMSSHSSAFARPTNSGRNAVPRNAHASNLEVPAESVDSDLRRHHRFGDEYETHPDCQPHLSVESVDAR